MILFSSFYYFLHFILDLLVFIDFIIDILIEDFNKAFGTEMNSNNYKNKIINPRNLIEKNNKLDSL